MDEITAPGIHVADAELHRDRQGDGWGQSPAGMDAMAERWLAPGWSVCDPMAGGGATALAAWRRGCDVLASDIDPAAEALGIEPEREGPDWPGHA